MCALSTHPTLEACLGASLQGWECDLIYEDDQAEGAMLEGGLDPPLGASGFQDTVAAEPARVPAGKRRLDHIGAEIIKASQAASAAGFAAVWEVQLGR